MATLQLLGVEVVVVDEVVVVVTVVESEVVVVPVVVVEPVVVVLGAVALHCELPSEVAHISLPPAAYRWSRAATSNAAGLGLPELSKSVPAPEVPSQESSSRPFQLMNSKQLFA
jgi:hypothetical protein